jgi:hypothetical protein
MKTFLALAPSERGSMVLLTERRRDFGPMTCEGCGLLHGGGHAHAAIVQESDDADTQWLLWVFDNGFSVSDESANGPISICADCQVVPVIRSLRFDPIIPVAREIEDGPTPISGGQSQ